MKRLYIYLILLAVCTACYDEFRMDHEETAVIFSTGGADASDSGVLVRTVVLGEGLNLNYGPYLSGVIENDQERWADFIIDPSLLEGTPYELLPEDYYTLSHESRFVIPKGKHVGPVTIELDSTRFIDDDLALEPHYAVPFRITDTSEDNILESQSTKVVVLKYINRNEGYYDHSGTFTTFDNAGSEINSGVIDNVLNAVTLGPELVRVNGLINQRGVNHQVDILTENGQNVVLDYYPNPNPPTNENVALESAASTSYVSPWENVNAINNGYDPQNSADNSNGIYGNWPEGEGNWQWVQYDFQGTYNIDYTEVYWFSDGGGILAPNDDAYIEYRNSEGEWIELDNPLIGNALDQWNVLTPDEPITAEAIRLNFFGENASTGIIEWRVWGISVPNTPEQAVIMDLEATDENIYNAEGSNYTLNYRVNFENGSYSVVSSEMVWRNRVRDGVNEWRR